MSRPAAASLLASVALVSVALVSGCTGGGDRAGEVGPAALSQPPAADFLAGTCRSAADDVLSVGRDARALGSGPAVAEPVLASLSAAQSRLDVLARTAAADVRPPLRQLIVTIGLVRLRAVGSSLDGELAGALTRDYEGLLGACTP